MRNASYSQHTEFGPTAREHGTTLPVPGVLCGTAPRPLCKSCCGRFGQIRWIADISFGNAGSKFKLRGDVLKRGSFLAKPWRFHRFRNARFSEPTARVNAVAGSRHNSANAIDMPFGEGHSSPFGDITSAHVLPGKDKQGAHHHQGERQHRHQHLHHHHHHHQGCQPEGQKSGGCKPVWQQMLASLGLAATITVSLATVRPLPCRAQDLPRVAAAGVGQVMGGQVATPECATLPAHARQVGAANPIGAIAASPNGVDAGNAGNYAGNTGGNGRTNGTISSALERIIVDFCPRRETDAGSEMTLWRSLVEEAEYAVSIFLENNPFSKLLILALITATLTTVGGVAYYYVTPPPWRKDLLREMWTAWTMVVDSGTHTMETDIRRRLVGVPLTIGGMLFFALLVGLVSEGVIATMDNIQQGNFRVREADHVIILGWTPKSPPLVKQLCMAYSPKKKIVVLGMAEKKAMTAQLEQVIPNFRRKRQVTLRSGDPDLQADVLRCGATTASHIVVLSTCEDPDASDAKVVEMCLMIDQLLYSASNGASRRPPPAVVAEFHEPRKFALLTSDWLLSRSTGKSMGGMGGMGVSGTGVAASSLGDGSMVPGMSEGMSEGSGTAGGAGSSIQQGGGVSNSSNITSGSSSSSNIIGTSNSSSHGSGRDGSSSTSGSPERIAGSMGNASSIPPHGFKDKGGNGTSADGRSDRDVVSSGPRWPPQAGTITKEASPAGLYLSATQPSHGGSPSVPVMTSSLRTVLSEAVASHGNLNRIPESAGSGGRMHGCQGVSDGCQDKTHQPQAHTGHAQQAVHHAGVRRPSHHPRFHHHHPSLAHVHSPHHNHHRGGHHHHHTSHQPSVPHRQGDSRAALTADGTRATHLEGTASFQQGPYFDSLIDGSTNKVVIVPGWGLSGLKLIMAATGDLASKLLVQKIYEPDVAAVLRHLLTYEGCEIYEHSWPVLEGRTFGETMLLTQGAVPMGLYRAASNHYVLNPGRDVVIEKGDRLIVLCEDNTSYSIRAPPAPPGSRKGDSVSNNLRKPSSELRGSKPAEVHKPTEPSAIASSSGDGVLPEHLLDVSSAITDELELSASSVTATELGAKSAPLPPPAKVEVGASEPQPTPSPTGNPHLDSPHSDNPHLDSPHLDSLHLESPHLESPHLDIPYSDGPHERRPMEVAATSHGDSDGVLEQAHAFVPAGARSYNPTGEAPAPEKLLVAGWRPGMHTLLSHLADLLPAGSEVTLLNMVPCDRLNGWPRSLTLHHIAGDPASMDVLDSLPLESYDRVVVVGTRGDREALTAAVYISHLQHVRGRGDARVVLELKSTLSESSHLVRSLFRDTVVLPNEIKGMILAHLVENVYMGCLLTTFVTDTSAMDIRMSSVHRFAAVGEAVSVSELMSRALDKNEIVLGYRRAPSVPLAGQGGLGDRVDADLVLNPLDKETKLQWGPHDSLIVLGARHPMTL
eukprot:jgi/Mesvir1/28299/Mv04819-RA.2